MTLSALPRISLLLDGAYLSAQSALIWTGLDFDVAVAAGLTSKAGAEVVVVFLAYGLAGDVLDLAYGFVGAAALA